eukprot:1144616-Pelagomonas_calceolata.AAC.2
MAVQNASCFSFAARNNERGPVRVEEGVISKGSATEVACKVVICGVLIWDTSMFVAAPPYM